jgi:hypothetical protein
MRAKRSEVRGGGGSGGGGSGGGGGGGSGGGGDHAPNNVPSLPNTSSLNPDKPSSLIASLNPRTIKWLAGSVGLEG